jgi:hypothetical protein
MIMDRQGHICALGGFRSPTVLVSMARASVRSAAGTGNCLASGASDKGWILGVTCFGLQLQPSEVGTLL